MTRQSSSRSRGMKKRPRPDPAVSLAPLTLAQALSGLLRISNPEDTKPRARAKRLPRRESEKP